MMPWRRWLFAIVLVGCKRQEDATTITFSAAPIDTTSSSPSAANATATATASPSAIASASAAPAASVAPSDRNAELAKRRMEQAEQMQMRMLQALDSKPMIQGALNRGDVPVADLSLGAAPADAGHTPSGPGRAGVAGSPAARDH